MLRVLAAYKQGSGGSPRLADTIGRAGVAAHHSFFSLHVLNGGQGRSRDAPPLLKDSFTGMATI
jgi:hypothetical protein